MTLLKIAFRNVLKNRRRSLITVLAIAFGYMAVAVFNGYTRDAYERMAMGAIFLEGPGHLVFFKKGFREKGRLDPYGFFLSGEEVQRTLRVLRTQHEVIWAAPKLCLSGLITNGTISTIFLADAISPRDEAELWSHWSFSGGPARNASRRLDVRRPTGIYLGPGLAKLLGVAAGDSVVLLATTVDGQMNALDGDILGTYPTFADAANDMYIRMPLSMARELYAFDGADRIGVLLRNKAAANELRPSLLAALRNAGLEMEASTWAEMSSYYRQAKNYLDVVFLFLFTIVILIVVMSTVNTMMMAVYERAREVGTLRAIGMHPRQIYILFAIEGALLGAFGSGGGCGLAIGTQEFLKAAKITYCPPGVADPVAIAIDLTGASLLTLGLLFTLFSGISSLFTVRRIVRKRIVQALTAT